MPETSHKSRSKKRKKRSRSSSTSSSSSDSENESSTSLCSSSSSPSRKRRRSSSKRSRKKKSTSRSRRKEKKRSRSSSSSSDSSSSSSSSSAAERKKKRRKKKQKKKKLKKVKKKNRRKSDSSHKSDPPVLLPTPDPLPDLAGPKSGPKPRVLKPMTKEEWEKQQSVVRKVYDEETGRERLIKGDGEVLEEIVSRDRHKDINKVSGLVTLYILVIVKCSTENILILKKKRELLYSAISIGLKALYRSVGWAKNNCFPHLDMKLVWPKVLYIMLSKKIKLSNSNHCPVDMWDKNRKFELPWHNY